MLYICPSLPNHRLNNHHRAPVEIKQAVGNYINFRRSGNADRIYIFLMSERSALPPVFKADSRASKRKEASTRSILLRMLNFGLAQAYGSVAQCMRNCAANQMQNRKKYSIDSKKGLVVSPDGTILLDVSCYDLKLLPGAISHETGVSFRLLF